MNPVHPFFAPRRVLGRTGFAATLLGIGDLADRNVPIEQCAATIRRALDAGLNVIDTAPQYEDGYSEQIVGRALRGRREGLFVIDKIDHPDQPVAAQVEQSLRRLELPGVDLFVFHGVSQLELWERIAATHGPMDELAECVRRGQARFRGVSSHHPDVLRAAILSGTCDVVLFPVGPFCDRRYIEEILPLARERGVGTVCFKSFGAGKLLGDTEGYGSPLSLRPRGKISSGGADPAGEPTLPRLSVEQCLHYTLTCDPDVALLGLSFPNEQDRHSPPPVIFARSRRSAWRGCASRPSRRFGARARCGGIREVPGHRPRRDAPRGEEGLLGWRRPCVGAPRRSSGAPTAGGFTVEAGRAPMMPGSRPEARDAGPWRRGLAGGPGG